MIKSKVGVDFDVPHDAPLLNTLWGTSKSIPTLFFTIETLKGTKWEH